MTEQLRVGRREVAISHPDRVVFPGAGLTKLDLARHYERLSEAMVPLVAGRPLALEAFPSGVAADGFFMKAVPGHFPTGSIARPCPVATPLDWDELSDARLKPDRWTIETIGKRLDAEGQPWKGIGRRARALPAGPK